MIKRYVYATSDDLDHSNPSAGKVPWYQHRLHPGITIFLFPLEGGIRTDSHTDLIVSQN